MKLAVFVALIIFSAVCLVFGLLSESAFTQTFWAELLWVAIGILVTTYLIDRLISRDNQRRRRNQLQLGLRYQCGRALEHLTRIVGNEHGKHSELATSVTRGGDDFIVFVEELLDQINRPDADVSLVEYERRHNEIADTLRDLAYNIVRVDSPGDEMVERSRDLTELALNWNGSGATATTAEVRTLAVQTGAAVRGIVQDAAANQNFQLAE